ncbi:MAG TPA: sigma-54 dependent transcriptional regulator [Bryobacteraceae bacterium]|nr:sigma-54 dependent transcriptional regulator [Bryobacteraceae bacterium]
MRGPQFKNSTLPPEVPEHLVFGTSPPMLAIRHALPRLAQTNVPVLISGESGTGKEVLARFIHTYSSCPTGSFVKLNCLAVPEALLESELFGYEGDAFTGVFQAKPGWVEVASGGTLFLDEIAGLGLGLQSKLLRFLKDDQYTRIGVQTGRLAAIRLLCATNRDLTREVEAGNFLRDLFFRINVISLRLPPLRERKEDIPALAAHFANLYARQYGCSRQPLRERTCLQLIQHDWPGNIRELQNVIRRLVILGCEEALPEELLDSVGGSDTSARDLKTLVRKGVRQIEHAAILKALHANRWNRRAAARELKISYRALLNKMRDAEIPQKRAARSSDGVSHGGAPAPEANDEHIGYPTAGAPRSRRSDKSAAERD